MRALGYQKAHSFDNFAIEAIDLPQPEIGAGDLLIDIRAIGLNPVDTKIRSVRSGTDGKPVILGWDASGIVKAVGADVKNFKPGDEVYYAGDVTRAGSYAEQQAVDARLVALKPKKLSFVEAAAMPLTSLTAYEMLFDQLHLPHKGAFNFLIIGGAGGVGSMAVQLAKVLTEGRVVATSGRAQSHDWLKSIGCDVIFDRSKPLAEEMKSNGIDTFDFVFSTTHTGDYLSQIPGILRPFGKFGLIDDPATLDIKPFKQKAATVCWEYMFARAMWGHHPETQGQKLVHVASLIDQGKIKTTVNETVEGLTVANIKAAHQKLEDGTAIGKIVLKL